MNLKYKEIVDKIVDVIFLKENKTFIIGAHEGPDGDNVGSTMAMYYLLKKLNKDVIIPYNPDNIPNSFYFLKDIKSYKHSISKKEKFDVGIVLDNSEIKRIGKDWPIDRIKTTIQIDHHRKANRFGDYIYIDDEASAVGEMLYFLFEAVIEKESKKLNKSIEEVTKEYLTKDVASALYMSIVTDTGSFKYASTSSKTFFVAQKLLEAGASPYKIYIEVYENVPLAKINLLQEVLSTLTLNKDKNFALMYLEKETLEKYNQLNLSEGFVNYGRIIKGVEISCFLKEYEKNKFKVSLRSKKYDVSYIAREYFNGGGHKNAAGGKIEGNIHELVEKLISDFSKWLAQ